MDTVKRVYELVEANHITLYQLTQKSGVSYSTIKTTEKRGGQLKVDTIERICMALGISLSAFFAE
jgi:transcriptional regulator with XRE-family HTH domain